MSELFNREAAAKAYDVVMSMDDDTAEVFVKCVTHGLLIDDLNANRRTVNGLVTRIHKSIVADLERVVSKTAVDERLVAEVISKAVDWDETHVKRDKGGRFSTVESRVRTDKTKRKMPKSRERATGIPSAKGLAKESRSYSRRDKLTPADRAGYQQQYLQLADAMDRMATSGGSNLRMVLEDKTTGRRSEAPVKNLDHIQGWNPAKQNLVATRFERPGTGAGTATFDVVSALGGGASASNAAQGAVQGVQSGGSAFAERWTDASNDPVGTNARTYRRIQAGSELVAATTPVGSKAHTAAKFGEFVGQYGPEAEKVVGPQMRKTAYRYRGIERKPDADLIKARNETVLASAPKVDGMSSEAAARALPAEEKMVASSRASTAYLYNRLPNLRLSEIQRKSGRIPPSEGVIIDRDGNIATQAVGHADDHYLPFNLKNLKGLQGGEYVRTRSKGGLTSEDIYTGLMSGARRVTVVSNSGIFTINFEDDFRGGRRYNDKAATMVDRYEKTLDALQGGSIEREPISPAVRAELLDEVEREYPKEIYSQAEQQSFLKQKIADYKENPQLTTRELESVEASARESAGGDDRLFRQYRAELMDRALESKRSRFYQLDGEGYSAALEALKEQYPYYIKSVTFMNRKEALNAAGERTDPETYRAGSRFKGGADEGYVAPRYNRPEAVLDGYYDPNVAGAGNVKGTGKTEASFTNYQNWEHNPTRRRTAPTETAPAAASGEAAAPTAPKRTQPTDVLAQARKEVQVESAQKQSMKSMVDFAAAGHDLGAYETLRAARDDFEGTWANPAKRANLIDELQSAQRDFSGAVDAQGNAIPTARSQGEKLASMLSAHNLVATSVGGQKFDRGENLGQRSDKPFSFEEPAYRAGATRGQFEAEMLRVNGMLKGARMGNVLAREDSDLASAAAAMGVLSSMAGASSNDAARHIIQVSDALGLDESWQQAALRDVQTEGAGKRYADAAEGLERLRALKSNQIVRNDAPTAGKDLRDPDPVAARQQLGSTERLVDASRQIASHMAKLGNDRDADNYDQIASALMDGDVTSAQMIAETMRSDGDPLREDVLRQLRAIRR